MALREQHNGKVRLGMRKRKLNGMSETGRLYAQVWALTRDVNLDKYWFMRFMRMTMTFIFVIWDVNGFHGGIVVAGGNGADDNHYTSCKRPVAPAKYFSQFQQTRERNIADHLAIDAIRSNVFKAMQQFLIKMEWTGTGGHLLVYSMLATSGFLPTAKVPYIHTSLPTLCVLGTEKHFLAYVACVF